MTLTITVQQDSDTPQTFTMSAVVVASLESYRQSILGPLQEADGIYTRTPLYADLMSMIVGVFTANLVQPAFAAFPLGALAATKAQIDAAQAGLAQAQAAAIQGALGS
jgi:hypothetical protein